MCDFSEKAIMLCKAAVMGDAEKYHEIAKALKPNVAKQLGRQVRGFDEATWKMVECSVAFEVVYQKFSKSPALKEILLKQDGQFAEMTSNDHNWGTGLDKADPDASDPSKWPGTNMLGWALTEAATILRQPAPAEALAEARKARENLSESGDQGAGDQDDDIAFHSLTQKERKRKLTAQLAALRVTHILAHCQQSASSLVWCRVSTAMR